MSKSSDNNKTSKQNTVITIVKLWWVAVILIIVSLAGGMWLGNYYGGNNTDTYVATTDSNDKHDHTQLPDKETLYTCPMHAQVQLPDPDARCPFCGMELVPLEDSPDSDSAATQYKMTNAAVQLAQIQTTEVIRGFPESELRLVGKIDFDETRISQIAAYFPGRLERLYVDYTGIKVSQGDHMAEIYSPDLMTTQEELKQATNALKQLSDDANAIVKRTLEATLNAAKDKLHLWGLNDEQIDTLATSNERMEQLTVYSPVNGVVVQRNALEGEYVTTGQVIYTVADLSKLWVILEVYESQLPWIHYGQKVTFTSESLPGALLEGEVSFIDPIVSEKTRTIQVRVNIDNTNHKLKPGMYVRALVKGQMGMHGIIPTVDYTGKWICPMHPEIVRDSNDIDCDICDMSLVIADTVGFMHTNNTPDEKPLIIPVTAPLLTGTRAIVYIQDMEEAEPVFTARTVTLGPRAGDVYIVLSGIEEGDHVVTNGAFKIDSALQILAKPSMMSANDSDTNELPQPDIDSNDSAEIDAVYVDSIERITVSDAFLRSLDPVYNSYLKLQEALAADQLINAIEHKTTLEKSITDLAKSNIIDSVDDNVKHAWNQAISLMPEDKNIDVSDASDEAIAALREDFERLSFVILTLEAAFGHSGITTVHRAYCPMAFDFKGAEWLQRSNVVNNPYFGDMMLRCGEIRQEYKPVVSEDE